MKLEKCEKDDSYCLFYVLEGRGIFPEGYCFAGETNRQWCREASFAMDWDPHSLSEKVKKDGTD